MVRSPFGRSNPHPLFSNVWYLLIYEVYYYGRTFGKTCFKVFGRESENIIINLNGPEHIVKQVKNGKTINTQTLDLNGVSELIQNYKASF